MSQNPLDIINRALQICERPHIGALGEFSEEAHEMGVSYDRIREYELQRNLWTFATRRGIMRALSQYSAWINFPAYSSSTVYPGGSIVLYNNQLWISAVDGNVGNTPGVAVVFGQMTWDFYFGPKVAFLWYASTDTTNGTTYSAGEIVYKTPGDGTYTIYSSLVQGNANDPAVVDVWSSSAVYATGDVVQFNGINYQSKVNLNSNFEPDLNLVTQWTLTITKPTVSGSWITLTGATLSDLSITYPFNAGPIEDATTRNAYALPVNFLKQAPNAPKEGQIPILGGPSGVVMRDWDYEGQFLISMERGPIMTRFIANLTDVSTMHPMFCEALAAALALGTHLPSRVSSVEREKIYNRIVRDARMNNAIEMGPVTVPDDEWISVRY